MNKFSFGPLGRLYKNSPDYQITIFGPREFVIIVGAGVEAVHPPARTHRPVHFHSTCVVSYHQRLNALYFGIKERFRLHVKLHVFHYFQWDISQPYLIQARKEMAPEWVNTRAACLKACMSACIPWDSRTSLFSLQKCAKTQSKPVTANWAVGFSIQPGAVLNAFEFSVAGREIQARFTSCIWKWRSTASRIP